MAGTTWSSRTDVWWAHLAAGLTVAVGVLGLLGASGRGAPAQVAVATVIALAGFEVKVRWPRLPSVVLAGWAMAPAVVVNALRLSEGTLFLIVVAVFFVSLTEPDGRIRVAVGLTGVLVPAFIAAVANPGLGWPFWMVGIAFGWLSGEQMRRFRLLVEELQATRERLATQAVHLERRRIAADLHDLVGHSLTVVLLYLTGARTQVEHDPAGAAEALRDAEEIGRASLAEIRRSVAALRDSDDAGRAPTPGACDVADLVNRFSSAGSTVALDVTGDLATVEVVIGLVAYRVVQESLNNAARHAPGAPVKVSIAVAADALEVSVIDEGPIAGFGLAEPAGGVGIIGMRERVEAVGGTLHAAPGTTRGWAVRARVPRPALVELPTGAGHQ